MASLAEWISPALGLSAALTVKPRNAAGVVIFCILPFFFFLELREEEDATKEESELVPVDDFF